MAVDKSRKSSVREYAEAFVIAILLALFIRTFVFQAFKIPSGSMLPTLKIGDHLLVNKFIYGIKLPFIGTTLVPLSDPNRGDVVVFRYPQNRKIDYIKRVIGLPGDILSIKNKTVFINGKKIDDPHAHFSSPLIYKSWEQPRDNYGPATIPDGMIFVMGDNRDNSHDSRFWGFVEKKDVLGKAFILYWSWDLDKPLFSLGRFTSVRWSRIGDLIH